MSDLRSVIAELESKVLALQEVCDERMVIIEGLEKAARERLELIDVLDSALRLQNSTDA